MVRGRDLLHRHLRHHFPKMEILEVDEVGRGRMREIEGMMVEEIGRGDEVVEREKVRIVRGDGVLEFSSIL